LILVYVYIVNLNVNNVNMKDGGRPWLARAAGKDHGRSGLKRFVRSAWLERSGSSDQARAIRLERSGLSDQA
jgi:hypothetical protein